MISAERAENSGFRASSDYSLLSSRKGIELISLTAITFSGFRRAKPCKVPTRKTG